MRILNTRLSIGILLAVFFGISLFLRIYLPYHEIFVGDWIKFASNDAYYHMRLVDSIAYNFPHVIRFDPYFIYPGGSGIGGIFFFDWLLAGIIWVISFGSPTPHTIDVVGAYYPAVLAALTIIPTYFIAKQLFGRGAGIIAAGLIAILPGEFMGRSILAFTDNHVAETLFSTVTMCFLILAIKTASERHLTLRHLRERNWAVSTRVLVYALLAGISLGVYLIIWAGGLLFVFIITAYLIVQSTIDHLRRQSTDYLGITGVILFLIAFIIFAPFSSLSLYTVPVVIAILVPPVLTAISRLMTARQLRPGFYPLTLVIIGAAALGTFYAINPDLVRLMLQQFSIFSPSGPSLTTLEMQPLFFPSGTFSLTLAWGNFTTSFFISVIALLILIYLVIRQGNPGKGLLLVWSLVILAANIGQRRFAYYFAVNVAVLTSYVAWQIIWLPGLKRLVAERKVVQEQPKLKHAKARPRKKKPLITVAHVNTALAIIVIILFVFLPNIPAAILTAQTARFAPSDGWMSAMIWLKDNTPEPFGNPDYYYQLYPPSPPGQSYVYPKTAYSVASWWDYGYWISRIAHRMPSANPSQAPGPIINVTQLFLAQEERPSEEIMHRMGSSYVVIDNSTTTSKFWAIITWAGKKQTDFFEDYYLTAQGRSQFVRLFYPGYYRSLSVRLYNFDGKAVIPTKVLVISWQDKVASNGTPYKEISSAQAFTTFQDAVAYIQSQKTANYKIVGDNPFISPVPLEALKDYKLVYSSSGSVSQAEIGPIPEVKVFAYTAGNAAPAQK